MSTIFRSGNQEIEVNFTEGKWVESELLRPTNPMTYKASTFEASMGEWYKLKVWYIEYDPDDSFRWSMTMSVYLDHPEYGLTEFANATLAHEQEGMFFHRPISAMRMLSAKCRESIYDACVRTNVSFDVKQMVKLLNVWDEYMVSH